MGTADGRGLFPGSGGSFSVGRQRRYPDGKFIFYHISAVRGGRNAGRYGKLIFLKKTFYKQLFYDILHKVSAYGGKSEAECSFCRPKRMEIEKEAFTDEAH